MERLTDNTNYCTSWSDCEMPEGKCVFLENCYDRKLYNKLKELEDLEEQGLLLRLPCKSGDDVWCIEEFDDGFDIACYRFMTMCSDYCFVTSFYAHCENYKVQLEEMLDDCQNWGHTDIVIFHKNNVFTSKAEAEKALAEMG